MAGSHDPFLVALSVLIALAASYAALDLTARVTMSSGQARLLWLLAASFAMGVGIWSMHFVGMLALTLPIVIAYDVPRVVLSALVAIAASLVALVMAARPHMGASSVASCGTLMGAAIAGTYYIGIAAMRAHVTVSYNPLLVVASVLVAVSASSVALWLAHKYRLSDASHAESGKAASALVMSIAIVGMHSTAMAAARFQPVVSGRDSTLPGNLVLAGSSLATTVALSTLIVLALVLIAAAIHRRVNVRLLEAARAGEQALRAHEAFLRQVIDADPNLVFVKDSNGVFTLANQAVAKLYATTSDMLVGKTDADFNTNADEVQRFLADDRAVIASGQSKLIAEEPVTMPRTGQTRWFQTVKVPLVLHDRADKLMLGVSTDITDRKLLTDQLRQAQKMEAIGQLTGGIAHDLNNILTIILANTDLMAQNLPAGLEEFQRDFIDLQRAATRGADTVRKLLAFSRREMIALRPLSLQRLCTDLQDTLRRLLPANIQVRIESTAVVPAVSADASAVEQMVLNLATNARDAMPDGGHLVLTVLPFALDAEWCARKGWGKPGNYITLAVSDTGTGIDASTRERIFEPFFTTKPQGVGTGLGLSMVYGLMRQHDGYVDVLSVPQRGTTVRLYFPAQGKPVVEGSASNRGDVRGGSETILVADDEESIRRSALRVLERFGYTVITAVDGVDALARLNERKAEVQLVISDIVMPRMGGRELYRSLRESGDRVPFLYMSGYAAREVSESIALDPEVPFLHKPWAMTDLLLKVREALDGSPNSGLQ